MTNNELNEKLARWAGIKHRWMDYYFSDGTKWDVPRCSICRDFKSVYRPQCFPDFTSSLDACFLWLPFDFDALWIIRNPNEKTKYCWGYARGTHNDVICWSKDLPIEDCLSPILEQPALALCRAIEQLIKETP